MRRSTKATRVSSAVFIGSKRFGLQCLNQILSCKDHRLTWALTLDDSSDARSVLPDFQSLCKNAEIPLVVATRPSEALQNLKERPVDLAFVNGWYWLFPDDLIHSFRAGMIGIHNSPLPKYRGGAPLVWQLLNGEKSVGSSIFYLSKEMDAGPLLHQIRYRPRSDDTIASVMSEIERRALKVLPSLWKRILTGTATARPQNHRLSTYCGQRIAEDGRIDWTWPAERILRFIRAQSLPYPGAFTHLGAQKIIIESASLWTESRGPYSGTPGQVLRMEGDRVLISCGASSALWIETIRHPISQAHDPSPPLCGARSIIGAFNARLR